MSSAPSYYFVVEEIPGLACSAGAAASCLQFFRLREPAVPALVFLECPFLPESNNWGSSQCLCGELLSWITWPVHTCHCTLTLSSCLQSRSSPWLWRSSASTSASAVLLHCCSLLSCSRLEFLFLSQWSINLPQVTLATSSFSSDKLSPWQGRWALSPAMQKCWG